MSPLEVRRCGTGWYWTTAPWRYGYTRHLIVALYHLWKGRR